MDERTRRLERQAKATGDYSDIINYLQALVRNGDAAALHELRARTAFHAIAEASRQTGWPEQYKNDLRCIDAQLLAAYAPPKFGFILRDSGTHIILPTSSWIYELDSVARNFNPDKRFYYWDGTNLLEVGLGDLRHLLKEDAYALKMGSDPELASWEATHYMAGTRAIGGSVPNPEIHPHYTYLEIANIENDIDLRVERFASRPDEMGRYPSDVACEELRTRLRGPLQVLDAQEDLRRELQLQEGYPPLKHSVDGYVDDSV